MDTTPIICDTNIWYRLSDGRLTLKDLEGKSLFGTFINAFEFCTSPNGIKDYQQLRKAIIAFRRYAEGFCIESPIEHIKKISGFESDNQKWKELSSLLSNAQETDHPNDDYLEVAKRAYIDFAKKEIEDVQPFTGMIEDHRKEIKYKGTHKKNMAKADVRYEHREITKQVITNMVGGIAVNWNEIELYLSTFDEWIRQLSMQPSLIMKPNDWDDVLNLVYVKTGCLYWTEDNKKTKEFISSCGCGHYLYKHS